MVLDNELKENIDLLKLTDSERMKILKEIKKGFQQRIAEEKQIHNLLKAFSDRLE
jgi:hypothetical protein